MVGYPGSGKTTTARIIHDLTGAVHIWADYERQRMFGQPTHSPAESRQLYEHLNAKVEQLLVQGTSVIFDTNFNYRKDRDLLRRMAARRHATSKLIWVLTPKDLAYKRATQQSARQPTRLFGNMSHQAFEGIAGHLEPPDDDEQPTKLDGTAVTPAYVAGQLGLPI